MCSDDIITLTNTQRGRAVAAGATKSWYPHYRINPFDCTYLSLMRRNS